MSRWLKDDDDEDDVPAAKQVPAAQAPEPAAKRARTDTPTAAPPRTGWGSAAGDAALTAMREVEAFRARQAEEAAAAGADARPAGGVRPPHLLGLSPSASGSDTPDRAVAALLEVPAAVDEEEDLQLEAALNRRTGEHTISGVTPPPDAARAGGQSPQSEGDTVAARLAAEEAREEAAARQALEAQAAALERQRQLDAEAAAAADEAHRRELNALQGCRSVEHFVRLNHIDEGTYGVVFRARDSGTGRVVALKKVKMEKEKEGFPLTSLREINILLSLRHPNIVNVTEVVVGHSLDSVFMVMEFMEHDLRGLLDAQRQPFTISEVKCAMQQLLAGVAYLHDHWVLHRDLKTSNVLINNRGELKLCDFGMARQYGSPLQPYTAVVCTLWYRAPELLLGCTTYSTAVDCWSLGCILAELLSRDPLLPGRSELEQIDKMFKLLGTPNERVWPQFADMPVVRKARFVQQPYNFLRNRFPAFTPDGRPALSEAGFDLLNRLLAYDPARRISAADALQHPWFSEVPLPKDKALMPTLPTLADKDKSARPVKGGHASPSAEQARREELQRRLDAGTGGMFRFAG